MALSIRGPPGELVLKTVFYLLCQVRFGFSFSFFFIGLIITNFIIIIR